MVVLVLYACVQDEVDTLELPVSRLVCLQSTTSVTGVACQEVENNTSGIKSCSRLALD